MSEEKRSDQGWREIFWKAMGAKPNEDGDWMQPWGGAVFCVSRKRDGEPREFMYPNADLAFLFDVLKILAVKSGNHVQVSISEYGHCIWTSKPHEKEVSIKRKDQLALDANLSAAVFEAVCKLANVKIPEED
ncbi:MAG: hypothetical protein KOO63_05665 [Bacteroidales bacterium]|nr:hypothetical protein [Candidatus Latescibacterota bacterium]